MKLLCCQGSAKEFIMRGCCFCWCCCSSTKNWTTLCGRLKFRKPPFISHNTVTCQKLPGREFVAELLWNNLPTSGKKNSWNVKTDRFGLLIVNTKSFKKHKKSYRKRWNQARYNKVCNQESAERKQKQELKTKQKHIKRNKVKLGKFKVKHKCET